MDHSPSPGFTNLLNSTYPSQDPENRNYAPPYQFSPSLSSSQYGQHPQPLYAQNQHSFPRPTHYYPFANTSRNQATHSMFGVGAGFAGHPSSSFSIFADHPSSSFAGFAGAEPYSINNLQASAFDGSPMPAGTTNQVEVPAEEASGSSPREDANARRRNWTEQENLRLISAWLSNSLDPVDGNSKKSDHYWKQVAEEYNSGTPRDRRRTAKNCKDHWSKANKIVTCFNNCWISQKNIYASGQSDQQLMEKARVDYKNKTKGKVFTMDYWWNVYRVEKKWKHIYEDTSDARKRSKISEKGTYISSSSKETEPSVNSRPGGQKGAKAKRKGKGASASSNLPDPTMQLYHDALSRKAAANEKIAESRKEMAESRKEKAFAIKEYAAATLEKAKTKKLSKYMKLIETDTSGYTQAQLD